MLAGWAPVWFLVDFSVRWHNLNSVASWCAYFTHWDILYRSDNFKRDPVTWGDFLSGNRKCKDHQEWQQQPLWEIHRDQLWQEVPDHRSEHEDVSLREIQSRFSGSISDKDVKDVCIWSTVMTLLFYSGRQRAKLSHILPAVFLCSAAWVQASETVWVFVLGHWE